MNVKLLLNKQVKELNFLQRLLPVMMFFLLSAAGLQAQTVSSDKEDYAPGEVAIISGSGWAGDNYVDVHFEETPAFHAEHQHDYHGIAVDENGNWTIRYQIEERHLGVAFDVHVVGKQTGREAHTYFTDALGTKLTVDPSTGDQGGAITLTATLVQAAGGNNATLGVGNGNGIEGMTVNFWLRNISVGSALTNANGVAILKTTIPSPIAPGTYSDGIYAEYTKPKNGLYNDSKGTATLTVNSAQATTSFSSLSSPTITYGTTSTTLSGVISSTNGVPSGSVAITLNGGTQNATINSSTGAFSSTFATNFVASSSPYPITYAYSENSNFSGVSDNTKSLTVNKANQVISWTAPSNIIYGAALSATQLNANRTTGDGALTYSPAAGTVLNAGTHTLSVTAAATDNYNAKTETVSITVDKADATMNVTVGGPYTFDNTAKGVQSATVTGVGGASLGAASVVYKQGTTTIASPTNAGEYEVHASFAGNDNYKPASDNTKKLIIGKAATTTVVTLAAGPFTYTGSAITPATVSVTGPGLNETPAASYSNNVNAGTATASFNYAETANYLASSDSEDFTIDQKAASVSPIANSKTYGAADPALAGTLSGFLAGDNVTATYTRVSGETVAGGPYTISATLSPAAVLGNYNITYNTADFSITAKAITVTPTAGQSKYCGQNDPGFTYTSSEVLLAGNSFSGALGRAEGNNVGEYAYTIGTLAAGSNYRLSLSTATPLATFEIKGINLNSSDASTPRSNTESVTISIFIKDGTAPVAGVPVYLYIDNSTSPVTQTTASDGKATFALGVLTVKVYKIEVVAGNGCSQWVEYMPIYDPTAGFVTGGGWINSPAGAFVEDASLAGKANFGFVSRYRKGSTTIVDGNTEFHFQAGRLNFKSSSHSEKTLVISGHKATYRGEGSIEGSPLEYKFMVSAVDGHLTGGGGSDKFRIKISEKVSGRVVYDNLIGQDENYDLNTGSTLSSTVIGGGSIVIHTPPTKGTKAVRETAAAMELFAEPETAQFYNYPNNFSRQTTIAFVLDTEESYSLEVYNLNGILIRKVAEGTAEAGRRYEYELNAEGMAQGMLIGRLVTRSGTRTIKMIRVN